MIDIHLGVFGAGSVMCVCVGVIWDPSAAHVAACLRLLQALILPPFQSLPSPPYKASFALGDM